MSFLTALKGARGNAFGMGMYNDVEEPQSPPKKQQVDKATDKAANAKLAAYGMHEGPLSPTKKATSAVDSPASSPGNASPKQSTEVTLASIRKASEAAHSAAANGKFSARESHSDGRNSHGDGTKKHKKSSDVNLDKKPSVEVTPSPLADPQLTKKVTDDMSKMSLTSDPSEPSSIDQVPKSENSKHGGVISSETSPITSPRNNVPVIEQIIAKSSVECQAFPLTPEQIAADQFVKIKMLGRGAIGRVYLVRHKDDLRDEPNLYAVKILTKEEMTKRNKVARVMTEREILATVNHPFVVNLYSSFQTPTRLYLVMEYMVGGEMFKMLQKQPERRLEESAVRAYTAEIVLALEYLHALGFVYRDLKPENVLIRADGHMALADFDLSKQGTAMAPKVVEKRHTFTEKLMKGFGHKEDECKMDALDISHQVPVLSGDCHSFVGTEEYLAPEVINGAAQSAAVDWWTLGILIYEMLTGETPFKGTNQTDTFSRIMSREVQYPDNVHVSKECKDLIRKLLNRDPAKRLGSTAGASEVRAHKFFSSVNFGLLRDQEAPYKPALDEKPDYKSFTKTLADMDTAVVGEGADAGDEFKGFDILKKNQTTSY